MAQPTAEPPTADKPPVVSLLPPGSANDRSGLESAAEASLPSTPPPVKADEPLSSSSSAASLTPTHRARFDIYLNHGPPSSPLAGTPRGMYEDDAEDDGRIEAPVTTGSSTTVLDIEHTEVDNDPRLWSDRKKTLILVMVSIASITPTLGAAIYNPAFDELRAQLHATDAELALSLSLFILFQGGMPIFWSAVAEVVGRKPVYLVSYIIFIIGTIVASTANSMSLLIVMRIVQASGSSAVMAIGAGTLADIFEPKVRGTKMGLYYATPLLGPSIGPLIGGALTQAYSWRATFYFIAVLAGISFVSFIFFPDTWRRERSTAYQVALKRSVADALRKQEKQETKRLRKLEKGLRSGDATPAETRPSSPHQGSRAVEVITENGAKGKRSWWIFGKGGKPKQEGELSLSIRDINPLPPAFAILKSPVNFLIIVSSGLIFAAQYTVAFTAAVTFAAAPYNYDALKVGLVLVAFGGGNILGSVLGGRYSDYILAKLKKRNGGVSEPEMRLKSMFPAIPVLVVSFLGYAWTAQEKTNIAGPIVFLAFGGFALMVIYASVLAFLVDSNVGRSSSAVACNSFFRGLFAFIMSEIALPIRSGIGDGGLYTLFAGLLILASAVFITLGYKGKEWRESDKGFFRRKPKKHLDEAEMEKQETEVPSVQP